MTNNNSARPRCAGKTAKNTRCKRRALPGEQFCVQHLKKPDIGDGFSEFDGPLSAKLIAKFMEIAAMVRRRMRGDYEIDDWGRDDELTEQVWFLAKFIYKYYWRVKVTGVENVPPNGRVLLVANHSGVLPYDGAMVIMAIREEHPQPRLARALGLALAFKLPITGSNLIKFGQVQASPDNARRLLEQDELALVFPEGVKGIGKPFSKRYQLARFGRGGFTRVALQTKSPIVPVSIVGAEEIHPMLVNFKPLASLFGIPYVPITPTFPWLGLLGAIPLPTKWHIHFDAPVRLQDMKFRPSEEPLLVSKISNQVRDTIQRRIHEILKTRRGVFL